MTRRQPRVAAGLPLARISGLRWVVAMCEAEWGQLHQEIPAATRDRLLAVMLHFCDRGERHLPRGSFRWLAPTASNTGGAGLGAFESRGVVLSGRAAPGATPPLFVITDITIDPPAEPKAGSGRRRSAADPRQSRLPFNTDPNQRS